MAGWPDPFPAYTGIFSYQVFGDERSAEGVPLRLGTGLYLWRLEMLYGTFEVIDSKLLTGAELPKNCAAVRCQMKAINPN
eukprot:SAG31_NODE_2591_length_5425_cov_4.004694_3_plen_80_part_00